MPKPLKSQLLNMLNNKNTEENENLACYVC